MADHDSSLRRRPSPEQQLGSEVLVKTSDPYLFHPEYQQLQRPTVCSRGVSATNKSVHTSKVFRCWTTSGFEVLPHVRPANDDDVRKTG